MEQRVFKRKPFIPTLRTILRCKDYQNIITLLQEGNGFIILNLDKFTKEVLQKHFKHCNFSSFTRQLNHYGFQYNKLKKGFLEYKHEQIILDDTLEINKQVKISSQQEMKITLGQLQQRLHQIHQSQQELQSQINKIGVNQRKLDDFIFTILKSFIKQRKQQFQGLEILINAIKSFNIGFKKNYFWNQNITIYEQRLCQKFLIAIEDLTNQDFSQKNYEQFQSEQYILQKNNNPNILDDCKEENLFEEKLSNVSSYFNL